jgi:hypothetical protein
MQLEAYDCSEDVTVLTFLFDRMQTGIITLAKAPYLAFLYPPHKWDGNEFKIV